MVRALLLRDGVRLVMLTGPGGVGKTRIALQVAADVLDRFAHGAWFVDLAPISDPALVVSAIAQVLDVQGAAGRPLVDVLIDALRGRKLLLVLDNFEQVSAAATDVDALLRACPRQKVLATSRAPLQVRSEHEVPVPPLGLPQAGQSRAPASLVEHAAVALFVERATAVKSDFVVSDENAPAIAEICVRLDELPLAIELAAARTRLLPPRAMLARLEQRLPFLTDGPRDLPVRQQTLRATIAWSYDLLEEAERHLFERLGVFVAAAPSRRSTWWRAARAERRRMPMKSSVPPRFCHFVQGGTCTAPILAPLTSPVDPRSGLGARVAEPAAAAGAAGRRASVLDVGDDPRVRPRAAGGERRGGLARRHLAVPRERVLPEPRSVRLRRRRRDAPRLRGDRAGRLRAPVRLPGARPRLERPPLRRCHDNEFRKVADLHVAALNHAIANIPADRVRLHLCWGNIEAPHVRDIPLAQIIDVVLQANVGAISFEAANPRHAHEWRVFEDVKLPAGMIVIPGVLDSTTNFVEHPELVAERIVGYARLVGRENVIAGSDCGFSSFARAGSATRVHPTVTWAKLQAMAEGARLASAQLWS